MIATLLLGSALLLAAPKGTPAKAPTAAETEIYKEFEETVAEFDTKTQIETWEVYLQKYPKSPYTAKVRARLADLRGDAKPAAKTPSKTATADSAEAPIDPDLAFLYESPKPAKPKKAAEKLAPEPEELSFDAEAAKLFAAVPAEEPAPLPALAKKTPAASKPAAVAAPAPAPAPKVAAAPAKSAPKPAADPLPPPAASFAWDDEPAPARKSTTVDVRLAAAPPAPKPAPALAEAKPTPLPPAVPKPTVAAPAPALAAVTAPTPKPATVAAAPKPVESKPAPAEPKVDPASVDPDLAFLYESDYGKPAATTPAPDAAAAAKPAAESRPVTVAAPAPAPAVAPVTAETDFFASASPAPAAKSPPTPPALAVPAKPAPTWPEPTKPVLIARTEPPRAASMDSAPLRKEAPMARTSSPRAPRNRRAPQSSGSWNEVALFRSLSPATFNRKSPGELYIRNTLTGLTVTRRFGNWFALEVEGAGAQADEMPMLDGARTENRQPEVLTKFNFLAGGGVQLNALTAAAHPSGRNDLFLHAGGGIVNADVEVCKAAPGAQTCAEPLIVPKVNFGYFTAGVGDRLYLTSWLALHTEVRGRVVLERIDGEFTPRTSWQVNVGPSVTF